jgi:hypothetical protein
VLIIKRAKNMTGFKDYANYDALGLAELVKTGAVTPNSIA